MMINYHKFVTCLNSSNTCCVLFSRWSGPCVRRYACRHHLLSALHLIGAVKPQISVCIMSTDVWCYEEMYWEPPRVSHWARYKAVQCCCSPCNCGVKWEIITGRSTWAVQVDYSYKVLILSHFIDQNPHFCPWYSCKSAYWHIYHIQIFKSI